MGAVRTAFLRVAPAWTIAVAACAGSHPSGLLVHRRHGLAHRLVGTDAVRAGRRLLRSPEGLLLPHTALGQERSIRDPLVAAQRMPEDVHVRITHVDEKLIEKSHVA